MTIPLLASLPAWTQFLGLAVHLAAGLALGLLYFRSLWRTACRVVGGHGPIATVCVFVGRFAALVGFLTLASLEGALPLLSMTLGLLIARRIEIGNVRGGAQ